MGHAHMNEFNSAAKPSSQTIFRIAQEISSLAASSSLPCSLSSSVFVRSDDSKMTLLKAIITGYVQDIVNAVSIFSVGVKIQVFTF